MFYEFVGSPVGELYLSVDEAGALRELYTGRGAIDGRAAGVHDPDRTKAVRKQLEEYFAGERREFDLTLAPKGTPFQQRVWAALLDIPYGETRSYRDIAVRLGAPQACRAVGRANGTNPISIIVPCHRVIGASGDLTGYGGGLPIKKWLLEFEGGVPVGQTCLQL